jgi:hypothetical protein
MIPALNAQAPYPVERSVALSQFHPQFSAHYVYVCVPPNHAFNRTRRKGLPVGERRWRRAGQLGLVRDEHPYRGRL